MIEQKIFVASGGGMRLFPNLYTMLVGPAGIGKSTAVKAVAKYLREIENFHIAPTDVTSGSIVDALVEAEVSIVTHVSPTLTYNSMLLLNDEMSNFMAKYDPALMGKLTSFYDTDQPYGERRRVSKTNFFMESPQLSMILGTTPSNLISTLPDAAWEQGFMSRVIMIYANDQPILDDIFAEVDKTLLPALSYDLSAIYNLQGQFRISDEYRDLVNAWNRSGRHPKPSHPKLIHYVTRRLGHLMKLSMISCVDRKNELRMEEEDFLRAKGWLEEAERLMPHAFSAQSTIDSRAMDEIAHFCVTEKSESRVVRFASERIAAHSVKRVIDLMVEGGMIKVTGLDKFGGRTFKSL